MSGNSALARVLSFRRPLSTNPTPIDATPEIETAADAAPPPASMPFPDAAAPAEASAPPEKLSSSNPTLPVLTVELPSLSRVTLVPAETPPAESRAVAPLDDARTAVTVDAITAIEADIASLLASMSELSDAPPATIASTSDNEGEDVTLALLSELDRMWQADPMVGAAHQS